MKCSLALSIAAAGLLLAPAPAVAHHSVSGDYFMNQTSTVEGDLVQFLFRNPHSWVEFKGKDPATGELVTWSVEWNGAGRLERDGSNRRRSSPATMWSSPASPDARPRIIACTC